MKKTRNILVSLLACLFVILAVPTAVSAAAKAPQCPKKQTLEFYRAHTSRGEVPQQVMDIFIQRIYPGPL